MFRRWFLQSRFSMNWQKDEKRRRRHKVCFARHV
jgi:hypothetical protein